MISPVLMRSAHSDVSLHCDSEGHVDGGAERDSGHGVQHVDIHLGQEGGGGEQVVDELQGGVGVDGEVGENVPSRECEC